MKLTHVKPHISTVSERDIRSAYCEDGSYVKKFPVPQTVGELAAILAQLPTALPLFENVELCWANVGIEGECLSIDAME